MIVEVAVGFAGLQKHRDGANCGQGSARDRPGQRTATCLRRPLVPVVIVPGLHDGGWPGRRCTACCGVIVRLVAGSDLELWYGLPWPAVLRHGLPAILEVGYAGGYIALGMISSSTRRLETRLSRKGAAGGSAIGARAAYMSRLSVSQQASAKVGREAQASEVRGHPGRVVTGQH